MSIIDTLPGISTAATEKAAHNRTPERLLLGSIINNPRLLGDVLDEIPDFSNRVFSHPDYAKIFDSFISLIAECMDINHVTVCHRSGIGEALIKKISSEAIGSDTAQAISYAQVLQDQYLRNASHKVLLENIQRVNEPDTNVSEAINTIVNDLSNIMDTGYHQTEKSAAEATKSVLDRIIQMQRHIQSGGSLVTGYPTGLTKEDYILGGYQKGNLIVVAARPGMGKTSKVLRTVLEGAKAGKGIGMFSLEMNSDEIFTRLLSIESQVPNDNIKSGTFNSDEAKRLNRAAETLSKCPIWVDDKGGVALTYIRNIAEKWVRKNKVQAIVIDHLGLIAGSSRKRYGSRTELVGDNTRGLKSLAKHLQIPIILLSQLSRAVETRGGSKRPQLSDLRDSGDIEQDADVVEFIYRDEYYGIYQDADGEPTNGLSQIIIAKNRNGALDTFDCGFSGSCFRFYDLESQTEENPTWRPVTSKPNPESDIPF